MASLSSFSIEEHQKISLNDRYQNNIINKNESLVQYLNQNSINGGYVNESQIPLMYLVNYGNKPAVKFNYNVECKNVEKVSPENYKLYFQIPNRFDIVQSLAICGLINEDIVSIKLVNCNQDIFSNEVDYANVVHETDQLSIYFGNDSENLFNSLHTQFEMYHVIVEIKGKALRLCDIDEPMYKPKLNICAYYLQTDLRRLLFHNKYRSLTNIEEIKQLFKNE